MKKKNQFGNEKLRLKKQAIANLSKINMTQVQGGEAAFTTSIGKCTGFLCCHKVRTFDLRCLDTPPIFDDGFQQENGFN